MGFSPHDEALSAAFDDACENGIPLPVRKTKPDFVLHIAASEIRFPLNLQPTSNL